MDIASFYSQLSRLHRLYTRGLVMRLDPYTVRPGYLDVLNVLWDEDNLTQKQLNAHLDIEQATLSNTLKRMERDGILTRIPNKKTGVTDTSVSRNGARHSSHWSPTQLTIFVQSSIKA